MNHKIYIDENPHDIINKCLIDLHEAEICNSELSIDDEAYSKCSCIIFSENGEQFAYYVFIAFRHHHYNRMVFQDVAYFIQKEFRFKYAREIFKIVEKVAKDLDCDLMLTHCKTKSQLNFFKKMNFHLKDYLLTKEI